MILSLFIALITDSYDTIKVKHLFSVTLLLSFSFILVNHSTPYHLPLLLMCDEIIKIFSFSLWQNWESGWVC